MTGAMETPKRIVKDSAPPRRTRAARVIWAALPALLLAGLCSAPVSAQVRTGEGDLGPEPMRRFTPRQDRVVAEVDDFGVGRNRYAGRAADRDNHVALHQDDDVVDRRRSAAVDEARGANRDDALLRESGRGDETTQQ